MTPLERELTNLLFGQWIGPAIKRREAAGTLAKDESFYAFQVIFLPDSEPDVRLNDEVVGLMRMAAADPGVTLLQGTVVDVNKTFERIEGWSIQAPNTRVGFATVYLFRGEWSLFFNAAHNLEPATKHLLAALEFLKAASDSIECGRLRVAVDTLFSATELLNKVFLFTFPSFADERSSHSGVSTAFFRLSRFHWFEAVYAPLVKKLPSLRSAARYLNGQHTIDAENLRKVSRAAEEFAAWLSETIADIEKHCLPGSETSDSAP